MAYEVGKLAVPHWQNVEVDNGLFTYTFIFQISSDEGLPPAAYGEVIRKYLFTISKVYRFASVWIQVYSPGLWYQREIWRGLQKTCVPVAVTRGDTLPNRFGFNSLPCTYPYKMIPPVYVPGWYSRVSSNELACLRVLARIQRGLVSEIASLAGFSASTARTALNELQAREFVELVNPFENKTIHSPYSRKYPYWVLKRPGLKVALRSWMVPPGANFPSRVEATHGSGEVSRHKMTQRLWPAWLKKSLGSDIELWAGWTEVDLTDLNLTPDALVWGRFQNHETLFWLEVESGHDSGTKIFRKILRRLQLATKYTRERNMRLVFTLLTRPWVQRDVGPIIDWEGIKDHVAVLVGDWMEFGELPRVRWGNVQCSID